MVPRVLTQEQTACSHTAFSMKKFLVEKRIATLENPPYFLDFAHENEVCEERNPFQSLEDVEKKMPHLLKQLSENELLHAFNQWKIRM
ncbi:hypothetical protein CEXT_778471 [Caerostris extrusa]|uniref:Uncharacterized protein n=1 Tax=Caerostris extrusa TaxID=172846 RepID=A0AAV4SCI7_CAEEX|nr:hypothetical protein CEXT_778471 [Caerostris extrusa]